MRLNDLSHGSIKTFLILGLLFATDLTHYSKRSQPQPPGSAGASPVVSRASRDTLRAGRELFGGAPKRAGEAPALPGNLPR